MAEVSRRLRVRGSRTLISLLLHKQSGVCFYCRRILDMRREFDGSNPKRREVTLDHLTPLSRGGIMWGQNVVVACGKCNHAKGPLTAEEFFPLMGDLGALRAMRREIGRNMKIRTTEEREQVIAAIRATAVETKAELWASLRPIVEELRAARALAVKLESEAAMREINRDRDVMRAWASSE